MNRPPSVALRLGTAPFLRRLGAVLQRNVPPLKYRDRQRACALHAKVKASFAKFKDPQLGLNSLNVFSTASTSVRSSLTRPSPVLECDRLRISNCLFEALANASRTAEPKTPDAPVECQFHRKHTVAFWTHQ